MFDAEAFPVTGPVTSQELATAQRQSGWTDLRISVALRYWHAGQTDAQVACLIGGVTRNAVIGARTRAGYSGKTQGRHGALIAARPIPSTDTGRSWSFRPAGASGKPRPRKPATPPPLPVEDDPQIPVGQHVTLMELEPGMCRWPIGEPAQPDFRFCGGRAKAATRGHEPYCAHHTRIAHDPTKHPKVFIPQPKPQGSRDHGWT